MCPYKILILLIPIPIVINIYYHIGLFGSINLKLLIKYRVDLFTLLYVCIHKYLKFIIFLETREQQNCFFF